MRPDLLPGTVTAVALGMGKAAVATSLVAAAGLVQRLPAGGVSAAVDAINLTTVTTAADQDLLPAAPAEKQTGRPVFIMFSAARPRWTCFLGAAILPAHSCPARCQARRRELGSWWAPCLPSSPGRVLPRRAAACQRPVPSNNSQNRRKPRVVPVGPQAAPPLRCAARGPRSAPGRALDGLRGQPASLYRLALKTCIQGDSAE